MALARPVEVEPNRGEDVATGKLVNTEVAGGVVVPLAGSPKTGTVGMGLVVGESSDVGLAGGTVGADTLWAADVVEAGAAASVLAAAVVAFDGACADAGSAAAVAGAVVVAMVVVVEVAAVDRMAAAALWPEAALLPNAWCKKAGESMELAPKVKRL